MGKPLLTDEIIARANRGEFDLDQERTKVIPRQLVDDQAVDLDATRTFKLDEERLNLDEKELEAREAAKVYKSRRIENEKRNLFQSKINRFFLVVLILLAFLIYAIFNL